MDGSPHGTYKEVHDGEPDQLIKVTSFFMVAIVALCSYQLVIPGEQAQGRFPADPANPLAEPVGLALTQSHGQGDGVVWLARVPHGLRVEEKQFPKGRL